MVELQLKRYRINYETDTSKGKRPVNEDRILVKKIHSETAIFTVADGMAGYPMGGKAAELAIETLGNQLSSSRQEINRNFIAHCLNVANKSINNQLDESGTTIGGIILAKQSIHLFWLGDVRIKVIQPSGEIITSKDHNVLGSTSNGMEVISPDEIKRYSNRVTKCLGLHSQKVCPDYYQLPIINGVKILISSDGVHGIARENSVVKALLKQGVQQSKEKIVELIRNEAVDNYSFILLKLDESDELL